MYIYIYIVEKITKGIPNVCSSVVSKYFAGFAPASSVWNIYIYIYIYICTRHTDWNSAVHQQKVFCVWKQIAMDLWCIFQPWLTQSCVVKDRYLIFNTQLATHGSKWFSIDIPKSVLWNYWVSVCRVYARPYNQTRKLTRSTICVLQVRRR